MTSSSSVPCQLFKTVLIKQKRKAISISISIFHSSVKWIMRNSFMFQDFINLNLLKQFEHSLKDVLSYLVVSKVLWYKHTLSKCPGGYSILHRGFKLNSKISAGKYKKIKFTGAGWFSTGELSKNYVKKMEKFHKTCCYFGQN